MDFNLAMATRLGEQNRGFSRVFELNLRLDLQGIGRGTSMWECL